MDRADRYVIVDHLAEGGMGSIYLGKKLGVDGFEKEVVLKQLRPEYTRDQRFIEMFLREARLSASLDHANIVRTVDLVHANDDYFMVMEYVRGADLGTLMRRAKRRRRPFSVAAALFVGHEILEALHYAHRKVGTDGRPLGLTHRDVSPSNILLSGTGEVKLTDFGIAKASTSHSVHKIKGKVGYMSPEQARALPIDPRSDLFSLGVVLYEMLSGERVFVGDLMSSAAMIYAQEVEPLSKKRRDVPRELDVILARAMALDPVRRYQTAEELEEALMQLAQRRRLLIRASELASQLADACGEDSSAWSRVETFEAPRTGTAVVSASDVDDDYEDDDDAQTRIPDVVQTGTVTMTSLILGGQATLSDRSAVTTVAEDTALTDDGFGEITTRARKLDRAKLGLPTSPPTASSELPTPPGKLPPPTASLPAWAPLALIGGLVGLFAILSVAIGWSGGQPDAVLLPAPVATPDPLAAAVLPSPPVLPPVEKQPLAAKRPSLPARPKAPKRPTPLR